MALFGGSGIAAQNCNTNNDIEVPNVGDDGISCVAWSCHNHLAAGSWDKTVRIWSVKTNQYNAAPAIVNSVDPITCMQHEAPVLCCNFSKDGKTVFSGSCDNKLRFRNLETNQDTIMGSHDAPIKEVFWIDEMQMVITGSWDKTLRFWDGKQAGPVATIQLPERVYSMDVVYPFLVVALAERTCLVYNLQNLQQSQQPVKKGETALKMQTRCVAAFPDKTGYAVGSIEGRCSIAYVQQTDKNFAFKCHRNQDEIYAVNAISFHPVYGTFSTAGSDGFFTFWDKDNRQRLKQFNSVNAPITATKFNHSGNLFAYAVSYDWGKGHEHNFADTPRKIFLHKVEEAEVKPKPANRTNARR